jgi:hypothetical protein
MNILIEEIINHNNGIQGFCLSLPKHKTNRAEREAFSNAIKNAKFIAVEDPISESKTGFVSVSRDVCYTLIGEQPEVVALKPNNKKRKQQRAKKEQMTRAELNVARKKKEKTNASIKEAKAAVVKTSNVFAALQTEVELAPTEEKKKELKVKAKAAKGRNLAAKKEKTYLDAVLQKDNTVLSNVQEKMSKLTGAKIHKEEVGFTKFRKLLSLGKQHEPGTPGSLSRSTK